MNRGSLVTNQVNSSFFVCFIYLFILFQFSFFPCLVFVMFILYQTLEQLVLKVGWDRLRQVDVGGGRKMKM